MIFKGNDDLSHVYLITRFNQAVLVDPSHSLEAITKALEGFELQAVLLTHGHIDHTQLIHHFKCPIYMHKDDYTLMFDAEQSGANSLKLPILFTKNMDIKFVVDGTKIPFSDRVITVIHTPGHTKGSVCYLYQDTLYTGDTLFKGSVGRTDLVGGSSHLMHKSMKHILESCPSQTKILPGHDEATSLVTEKKNNPFLK